MYDRPRNIEEILTRLAATPSRLAELSEGLPAAQLLVSPESGEWCARDVLAHLRACADMWGKCIVEILNEDRPTIKAVNPRTWIKKTDYRQQEFQPSLQAFTTQRAGLLAVLEALAPEDWSRAALVTGAGKPLERSVFTYARRLANHELPHINQIGRIANTLGTTLL